MNNSGALTTSGAILDNTTGNTISLQATSGTLTVGAAVTGTGTDTINLTTVTSGNVAVNRAVATGAGPDQCHRGRQRPGKRAVR